MWRWDKRRAGVECGSRAGGVRLAFLTFSAVTTSAKLLSSLFNYFLLSTMLDILIFMLINCLVTIFRAVHTTYWRFHNGSQLSLRKVCSELEISFLRDLSTWWYNTFFTLFSGTSYVRSRSLWSVSMILMDFWQWCYFHLSSRQNEFIISLLTPIWW